MVIHKKDNRIIRVDGLLYSLDTGRQVKAEQTTPVVRTPEKPKSTAQTSSHPIRGFDIVKIAKPKPLAPKPKIDDEPILPVKPVKPTSQADLQPASFQDQAQRDLSRHPHAVSHPTLPIDTAHSLIKSKSWLTTVLFGTLLKKTDPKIARISFVQAVFSPTTWLLLLAPLVFAQLLGLRNATIASLLVGVRQNLNSSGYWTAVWLLVFVSLSLTLLYTLSSMLGYAVYAIKIQLLDNRPSKFASVIKRSVARIDRIFLNWLYNEVMVKTIFLASAFLCYLTLSSTIASVVVGRTPLLILIVGLGFAGMILTRMAQPYQRALLATVDEKLSFIRPKSYGMLFKNGFLRNVLASASALFVNLALFTLALIVVWSQYTYLAVTQSTALQVGLVLGGIVLVLVILSVRLAWLQSFWAAHYHYVATRSKSGHLSAVLNQETTPKLKIWPIVRLLLFVILAVVGILFVAIRYEKNAQQKLQNIERSIPSDFTQLIPKNN